VYRFKLIQLKQETSQGGNPKMRSGWELDGSWKPEHGKFNGAPLWDHMPVMSQTAWRVKALCLALGVTARDFYGKTVVDEDGIVTKLGPLVVKDRAIYAYINVRIERDEAGEREDQLKLNGGGYLPKRDSDETNDGTNADEDDAEPEAKPDKAKKAKKGAEPEPQPEPEAKKTTGKKGKAKKNDDEPPF
jgi:hypothetical protein